MNYFFLYNLADGSIYDGPYRGEATVFNNIPSGCGLIGPIADTDITAQDAFQHPNYYLVQNGQLAHKTNVADLQFQDAQNAKEAELDAAYAQATQTFKSSATGNPLTYLVEDGVMMSKFNAQYNYANSAMYNGNPFSFYTLEQGGVQHTKDQFLKVWQEGHDWMQAQFIKWDNKQKQRKACTTTNNQLSSIVWNDTTPPAMPTGLTATIGTTQATLNWTANSEIDVQIGGSYNVYKSGVKLANVTANSYVATGLTSGTAVSFTISAVDSDGNESPQSASVTVTPT